MSPTIQNELIGKINQLNDLKEVKRCSFSVDKVTYVYVYIYVKYINEMFLFSSEKLEKDKHLKLVVSHLSTDFTYTLNHYCLFIQRQYTNTLTLFHVYITYIYTLCMYVCIYMIYNR